MADDPDRDILPVKEGSYADTLISAIGLYLGEVFIVRISKPINGIT